MLLFSDLRFLFSVAAMLDVIPNDKLNTSLHNR